MYECHDSHNVMARCSTLELGTLVYYALETQDFFWNARLLGSAVTWAHRVMMSSIENEM